jgi:hypothetical protein
MLGIDRSGSYDIKQSGLWIQRDHTLDIESVLLANAVKGRVLIPTPGQWGASAGCFINTVTLLKTLVATGDSNESLFFIILIGWLEKQTLLCWPSMQAGRAASPGPGKNCAAAAITAVDRQC